MILGNTNYLLAVSPPYIMDGTMKMIRVLLLGIAGIVLYAAWCQHSHRCHRPIEHHITIMDVNDIPSVREIQRRLKATGKARYDPGPIDGDVGGPDSQMRTAWQYYIDDQYENGVFKDVR